MLPPALLDGLGQQGRLARTRGAEQGQRSFALPLEVTFDAFELCFPAEEELGPRPAKTSWSSISFSNRSTSARCEISLLMTPDKASHTSSHKASR